MSSATKSIRSNLEQVLQWIKRKELRKIVSKPILLLLPYALLLTVAFVGPMAMIIIYSFSTNQLNPNFTNWTLDHYITLISDGLFRSITIDTLKISVISTILAFIISYPAAYALARKVGIGKFFLTGLMIVPLFTSVNIRVFGWFLALTQDGVLTLIMGLFGITGLPQLVYQEWTVILGITYVYLPYMLFPIYLSLENVDESYIEAAHDLGASRTQAFRTVILPSSLPGVLIGGAFCFVLSLGAHVEGTVLGGNTTLMLASEIQHSFGYAQDWATGSAQAMIMLVLALVAATVILSRINFEEIAGRGS